MPDSRVIDDVAAAVEGAATVADACDQVVAVLGEHTGALVAVLLHVHDRLRCMAATGTWQTYTSIALDRGVVARAYANGRTEVVELPATDEDYLPVGPSIEVEICAPIVGAGAVLGGLNVEWVQHIAAEDWAPVIEAAARLLGARIELLGGAPAESDSERLLRHSLALGTATTERELLDRSLHAAREVSGLSTPMVLVSTPEGVRAYLDQTEPTGLAARLLSVPPEVLRDLTMRTSQHGATYTLGDPRLLDSNGFELLTGHGVATMVTVPIGLAGAPQQPDGSVLVILDERALRPASATVNLLELLAAQAWTCLQRLRTVAFLHERAASDPLTGLRHQGPFGERLAHTTPGHTALLAIDVDGFKAINDTYGHQAGDRLLVELATALQASLRSQDDLYRIGGDEFAAVIEVQRVAEALAVARRLVRAARRLGRSVSVGLAVQERDETAEQTLRRADSALYQAKRAGRDGVCLA